MSSGFKVLKKKQILEKLVEKHERFLVSCTSEYDLLHKLFVLKEKQDQLDHWTADAESGGDEKKLKAYIKQKKQNDSEMGKISEELSKLSPSESNEKQRYNLLKQRIDSHRAAISHWSDELAK